MLAAEYSRDFAALPQLPIEGDSYDCSDADDKCENNRLIQRGGEYGLHKVIRYENLQREQDFGGIIQPNCRIIRGLSTKRARHELHDNPDASVEDDDRSYELEEGDNPAKNGDPIDDILEHLTSSCVCYQ
jgi:hypothetical protein